ncbi:15968_t:CDS:1 [Acaulospora morrowiae]|uniref:15968_t:CDS:1 n=1 Tax=Acaulospora morrowiae TaxID=94023 RepID=A0A9N9AG88_9GLOM|nr:15968_t:CDS:1 [Acaulospora morrowiae]
MPRTSRRPRTNATSACRGCQKNRKRCEKNPGEKTCTNCEKHDLVCDFTPGRKRGPKPKSIDSSLHADQLGTFQLHNFNTVPLYSISNSHGELYSPEFCHINISQGTIPSQTYVNDNYNIMHSTYLFQYDSNNMLPSFYNDPFSNNLDNFSSSQPNFYSNHHALANDLENSSYEQSPPEFYKFNNSQGIASSNAYNIVTSIDASQNTTSINFNNPLLSFNNNSFSGN